MKHFLSSAPRSTAGNSPYRHQLWNLRTELSQLICWMEYDHSLHADKRILASLKDQLRDVKKRIGNHQLPTTRKFHSN